MLYTNFIVNFWLFFCFFLFLPEVVSEVSHTALTVDLASASRSLAHLSSHVSRSNLPLGVGILFNPIFTAR